MGRVVQETGGLFGETPSPWTVPREPEPSRAEPQEPELEPVVPRAPPISVRWCREGARKLVLWRRDGGAEPIEVPFKCKSWRCPDCRPQVALVDYARVAQGIASRDRWLYVVLTLPGEARRHGLWERYRRAGALWDGSLRKRLQRRYGRVEYIQTWEAHRDGTPHVNIVLGGEALLDHVDAMGDGPERRHPGLGRPVRVPRWRTWWLGQAQECGFGRIGWVERLWSRGDDGRDPRDGLASYMVKLAHGLGCCTGSTGSTGGDGAARELVYHGPKDQTPTAAPRGFRRLRSSRGLLPPRFRGGDWTGTIRRSDEPAWNWDDARTWIGRRRDAHQAAVDTLCKLASQGLPIPEQLLRLALRDPPQTPDRLA